MFFGRSDPGRFQSLKCSESFGLKEREVPVSTLRYYDKEGLFSNLMRAR